MIGLGSGLGSGLGAGLGVGSRVTFGFERRWRAEGEAVQAQLVPPAALRAEEQLAHPLASQRAWRRLAVGSGPGLG